MPNLPVISEKELLGHLLRFGCVLVSVRGSHHKVEYPVSDRSAPIPIYAIEMSIDRF